jgi:uncharacterized repeat protein (TIGR03803 family)
MMNMMNIVCCPPFRKHSLPHFPERREKEHIVSQLSCWKRISFVILLGAATVVASSAQTFTTLLNFNGTNGSSPAYVSLVQGTDGNFYGTTSGYGFGAGTIFKITPAGTLTTLHTFDVTDGDSPYAGLALATSGNFYGTTISGGVNSVGTIFKITPSGTLTTLLSFDNADGANPEAGLVLATNGNLYGTTFNGGVGLGTIFKITPGGTLTTLHTFDGPEGRTPAAGLLQATNGNLYGTTVYGGADSHGTIFEITPAGTLTTLHSFDGTDGDSPYAGLALATSGNFYGTTISGGVNSAGTIFKITPAGTLTTLHSFDGTDGNSPYAGLVQATDGNFYGTTYGGGSGGCSGGCGTVFKITAAGTLTTLHSFGGSTDGALPYGGLLQGTDGSLYGTTDAEGAGGSGTVFRLSVGLSPFVKTLPTFGKVAAAVKILGTNLTGATSVSFNGTAAAFTVVSPSLISTTLPNAATTGQVQVTTPGGTLLSNLAFRVTPVILSFSPPNGPVSTPVVITGQSLTGASRVTFGGIKATSFNVDSYTQITATVPAGAKTGKIGVTTPGGTATSAGTFTVN